MVYVNSGKNLIRDYLAGTINGSPSYMAMGSVGSPAFTVDNSALRYEVWETTRTFDSRRKSDREIELEMILPSTAAGGSAGSTVTLRELVISSGSPFTAGSTFSLSTFFDISKTPDVEIQSIVSYKIL